MKSVSAWSVCRQNSMLCVGILPELISKVSLWLILLLQVCTDAVDELCQHIIYLLSTIIRAIIQPVCKYCLEFITQSFELHSLFILDNLYSLDFTQGLRFFRLLPVGRKKFGSQCITWFGAEKMFYIISHLLDLLPPAILPQLTATSCLWSQGDTYTSTPQPGFWQFKMDSSLPLHCTPVNQWIPFPPAIFHASTSKPLQKLS